MPKHTKEILQETVDLLRKHLTSSQAAQFASKYGSDEKGVPRPTFQHRIEAAIKAGLITKEEKEDLFARGMIQVQEQRRKTYDSEEFTMAQKRRMQDNLSRLQRELDSANRELNKAEDLRQSLFGLTSTPLTPAEFPLKIGGKNPSREISILFSSDFQWGEKIDLNQMDGMNTYDRDIAASRYHRLIETAISLSRKSNSGQNPEAFIYLRGGDSISGEIHMELAKHNDLLSIPALRDLASYEAGGLEILADELQCPIYVISCPGNHGRTTIKPESKGYVDTNYDDLLTWFLEMYFTAAGDDRITFFSPRSGDARFSVYGEQFLLTHGDRIGSRGGQGFVGPAATIARGMKKLSDYYSASRIHLDYILLGHFHTSLKLEHGFSNGSLAGLSEYARDLRVKPKPPTQWYFSIHPRRGLVEEREIMVGSPEEGSLCAFSDEDGPSVDVLPQ
jgi:hypothetical protein